MKEDRLEEKLNNVELPNIELKSHRSRLKMALLNESYLKSQKKGTIPGLVKMKIEGGINFIMKGLFSKQPVWKIGAAASLLIVLVLGLVLVLPRLTGQTQEALAASIASKSPEVLNALDGSTGEVSKVVKITDSNGVTQYLVSLHGDNSEVLAGVAINDNNSIPNQVIFVLNTDFTDGDKTEAVNIAEADPEIMKILDQGATINWMYGYMGVDINQITTSNSDKPLEFIKYGELAVRGPDGSGSIVVDLNNKKVEKFWYGLDKQDQDESGKIPATSSSGAP
jgi:hypothetical protein